MNFLGSNGLAKFISLIKGAIATLRSDLESLISGVKSTADEAAQKVDGMDGTITEINQHVSEIHNTLNEMGDSLLGEKYVKLPLTETGEQKYTVPAGLKLVFAVLYLTPTWQGYGPTYVAIPGQSNSDFHGDGDGTFDWTCESDSITVTCTEPAEDGYVDLFVVYK